MDRHRRHRHAGEFHFGDGRCLLPEALLAALHLVLAVLEEYAAAAAQRVAAEDGVAMESGFVLSLRVVLHAAAFR